MDDDFDLYEDILSGKDHEKPPSKQEVEQWREEVAQARTKVQTLMEVNSELKKKVDTLETNISSLLKTSRSEINRKNNTIAELRRELESVVLRRTLKTGSPSEIRELTDRLKKVLREDKPAELSIPEGPKKVQKGVLEIQRYSLDDVCTVKVGNTSFTTVIHGDSKSNILTVQRTCNNNDVNSSSKRASRSSSIASKESENKAERRSDRERRSESRKSVDSVGKRTDARDRIKERESRRDDRKENRRDTARKDDSRHRKTEAKESDSMSDRRKDDRNSHRRDTRIEEAKGGENEDSKNSRKDESKTVKRPDSINSKKEDYNRKEDHKGHRKESNKDCRKEDPKACRKEDPKDKRRENTKDSRKEASKSSKKEDLKPTKKEDPKKSVAAKDLKKSGVESNKPDKSKDITDEITDMETTDLETLLEAKQKMLENLAKVEKNLLLESGECDEEETITKVAQHQNQDEDATTSKTGFPPSFLGNWANYSQYRTPPQKSSRNRTDSEASSVDFNSIAGIASILKGQLVPGSYVSPRTGMIRTPTPSKKKPEEAAPAAASVKEAKIQRTRNRSKELAREIENQVNVHDLGLDISSSSADENSPLKKVAKKRKRPSLGFSEDNSNSAKKKIIA